MIPFATLLRMMLAIIAFWALVFLFFFCSLGVVDMASGQSVWTRRAEQELKRCLIAEADGYPADRAPIAYVLQRRAALRGWPVARMARSYCQYRKAWRPRARAVLLLPRIVDPKYDRWKQVWADLDKWVPKFVAGRIPDPCPRAVHWSGETDPKPGPSLVPVNCGETKNTFFARRPSEADVLDVALEMVRFVDRMREVLKKEVKRDK